MTATSALGWALVHFVWQGAVLAVLLGIALALIKPTAARTRYALAVLTLVAMMVVTIATGVRLLNRAPDLAPAAAMQSSAAPDRSAAGNRLSPAPTPAGDRATLSTAGPPTPSGAAIDRLRDALEPALPWLVVVWVFGVLVLSIRLAHGWLTARRLRTHGTRDSSAALTAVLARLATRLRVTRPVRLLESLAVEVPAVIGWLRPVILVPTSALTGLTPQQLEVLLAHELAHVRRYDYLVNVVQCAIETLLFYHPAVWWVSRCVREEREHCCDDLVVATCGDPRLYASALVGMERLRPAAPRLAMAATGGGGSLLHRVQRLLMPANVRAEYFPRWSAGIAGVFAVTVALFASGRDHAADARSTETITVQSDTTRLSPDTVVRAPDFSQTLAQRWDWARAAARQLGKRAYWVGYTIPHPEWLDHSVYVDRGMEVKGENNITIGGRMYGNFQGFMFRGVRLGPLTGAQDSDDIVILFAFTIAQGGTPTLAHVHVASSYLPIDFRGRSLLWLGPATEAQSLPVVEGVLAATTNPDLREDVVAAIGIHGSSAVVVPTLVRLLTGTESDNVRSQAAEWLGFHPTPAAVVALSAAARGDRSGDVRREAAEALGENTLPAATDSAIGLAKTARDADTRRQAVESLGEKGNDQAYAAVASIARTEPDDDVARAAVEALGEMPSDRGLAALRDIARTHPRPDVRRAALETLADHLPRADAVTLLKTVATNDAEPDVQRDAIEKLADLAPTAETATYLSNLMASSHSDDVQRQALESLADLGELGMPAVIAAARTHPSADLRRAAVETIGDKSPAQALDLLAELARRDRDPDVQRQAVETLGDLHNARAYNLLVDLARTHPSSDVRQQAIETLGDSKGASRDSLLAVLSDFTRDRDADIAGRALETLGDMHDARALAIVARVARGQQDEDTRSKAIETYVDAASTDSALALLKSILASDASEDITNKVLGTLEDMHGGAGIPLLIETARSHPNRAVRADALRRLAESDDPRVKQLFDETLRRP
ncbi:MAG TPA: HEAT repeat domain-containing protein [Gemmatimonadales bacterium]|nr:HEAT repeat domain-containing protein [Gemmatimonadales bacterium]